MDFSKLKYRVDQVPDSKSIVMSYPDLGRLAHIFSSQGDMPMELTPDFVMRYIILMYAPGSPFVTDFSELKTRKAKVLAYLNVKVEGKAQLPAHYNNLIAFKYGSVVDKAVLFLRLCKNHEWALLRAAEEKQFLLISQMFTKFADVQDEKRLQDAIKANMEMLKSLKESIVDREKSLELDEGVSQYLAEENLGIDPETYIVQYGESGTVFPSVMP